MHAPHILGVDDDPAIRQLIADYLTENGFRVSTAADAKAMRQRLTQGPVDLVVLDIRLGQEDGMVLARELRATSEVPIIMLTGQREEADRVMGLELGGGRLPHQALQPARAARSHPGRVAPGPGARAILA